METSWASEFFQQLCQDNKEDVLLAITAESIQSLFTILSSSVENGQSGQPICTSEVDLSLQCIVKIVHTLHLNRIDCNQGSVVNLPSVLQQYFELLDQQSNSHEAIIIKTHLLDAICQMLDCKDKPVLQAVCLGLSCFKRILGNLNLVDPEGQNGGTEVWNKLIYSIIRALQALIDSSSAAKEVFEAVSGYDSVKKCLLKCHSPSKDVLFGLLKWMVGKDYQDGYMDIEDENLVLILIDWLPFISSDLQRLLSEILMQTVMFSAYNLMVCSKAGVATSILDHLKQRNHLLDLDAREMLFIILEVLGSASMKPKDFQELIGLLRPQDEGRSDIHDFDRLLEALIKISTYSDAITQPLWYFDLRHKTSGIAIPPVQKWSGSGFTFHAWISLKAPRIEDTPEMPKTGESTESNSFAWSYRRQLYSFVTSSGVGFEGFFTSNGHLVVAVCTKKEYLTAPLVDMVLADDQWHSLLIVHTPSRKPLSRKDQLNVYVDGQLRMSVPVKLPPMSEPFTSCHIGCGGPQTISLAHDPTVNPRNQFSTQISSFLKGHFRDSSIKPAASCEMVMKFRTHTPTGHQDDFWGTPESMQGQLGPVCVFNDAIQEQYCQVLFNVGPDCVSLFQPQGTAEEDSHCVLPELASKLVLYYNAKACTNHKCTDLTPHHPGHTAVDGRFTGEVCFNWDIKNVINSVGGMEVFLPLLEQVEYHERIEKSEKWDVKAVEVAVEEKPPVSSDLNREVSEVKRRDSMEQWVVVEDQETPPTPDPPHKTRHLAFDITQWSNGVTIILRLLQNILKGSTLVRDSFLRSREIATLGVVLAKIDGRLLDVPVLMAVQKLIETVKFSNKALMPCIFQYILFNFALWSRCDFAIRIGHIQYVSTVIKDEPNYFRTRFGSEFILDVIKTYYEQEPARGATEEEQKAAGVDDSGAKIIRGSLFGMINYYLKQNVDQSDVRCLMEFVATMNNETILKEVLNLIHSLCKGPTKVTFIAGLSSDDHLSVLLMLLINLTNPNLRCVVIRILISSLSESSLSQATKDNLALCSEAFPGLAYHLRQTESDGFAEITLMELGLCSAVEFQDLWVYDDFRIVLPIVGLVQNKEISVKLHIAQTLLKSVEESVLSAVKCAQEVAWYDPIWRLLLKTRQQVEMSKTDADLVQDLLETVVQIIFKVLWVGIDDYDEEAWKARGEVIASISTISSLEDFVVPSRELERRLLELCMKEILEDIEKSGETGVKETTSALQVMKLLDDFIFTSGSIAGTMENENRTTWSTKLVETMVQLLGCLNVWDQSDGNPGWTEMAEIGDKVLLEFLLQDNPEFCAYSSSMIYTVWKNRCIDSQEKVCYLLGKVYQAFKMSKNKEGDTKFIFTLPLLRYIFQTYGDFVPLAMYVPEFPKPSVDNPDYEEKFLRCVDSDEFAALIKQQILPNMKKYEVSLSKSAIDSGRFWMQCLNGLTNSLQARTDIEEESKKKFESIVGSFNEMVKKATVDFKNRRMEELAQMNRVLRQWDLTKRDLSSEIGIWASRNVTPVYWKLSTSENFSRMRLKMTPNYHFNPHVEASQLRDKGVVTETGNEAKVLSGSVADQVLVKHYAEDRLEETENVEFPADEADVPSAGGSKPEASFDCELVTLMETVSGRVCISSTSISFTASNNENNKDSSFWDFKIALSQLREVHLRNFNHRRSALEFFLIDQTNYFINFSKETRNIVYKTIMSFRPPNIYYCDVRSPTELLQASGLVKKWVRREISNFDYLIQLNTIAGRTYNDLSQYPVFPWILKDYTSEELDLQNPDVYRDLTKPIGALNEKRAKEVKERYDLFVDPSGSIPRFHYGVHYSTAAGVLHYLVRMEPFTSLHIKLQSGRFDVANRQFYSLSSTWQSIFNYGNDVKELIPEFFYLPEFLTNLNDFDLGVLQSGQRLNDVVLPKWASSPQDFIHKHREALESDYVSENLHHWIDLIFGYKQRGADAEEALNVFYYSTYEGAVDLDAITDPKERHETEEMINNFGQTPTQLLTEPHTKRMNPEEARELQKRHSVIPGNLVKNVLREGGELKAHSIKIYSDGNRLIYAKIGQSQSSSMINQGMHDSLITVSAQGIMGVHQWLPYSRSRSQSFTFNVDATVTQSNHHRCIAAPFAPDICVGPHLFAVTHCAKLIITAGHWDFSIRVFTSKAKLLQRLTYHNDTVMCVGLDGDGHHFMSGSRDFTCMVWLINHQSGVAHDVSGKPLQVLYGHDDEVTCVAISWELDIAVSGDKNGRCIVHTVRKGHFVRVLNVREPTNVPTDSLHLQNIALSKFGDIFVSCLQDSKTSCLCKFSVNGQMLREINLKDEVTAMIVRNDVVLIGTSSGAVYIKRLHSLENERTLNVRVRICSINITKENTHIFIGGEHGQLLVFSVDSME